MVRLRKALRRRSALPIAVIAVIAVAAVACLVALLDLVAQVDQPASRPATLAAAPPEPVAVVAADKRAERLETAAAVDPKSLPGGDLSGLSPFEVPPPLRSIDGTSFRQGEEVVRIAGIEGPAAGDVCRDGEVRWSCGLQARAALHNLVSGRSLICQPRRALGPGVLSAECRVARDPASADDDVGRALVRRGWARPVDAPSPQLAEAMEEGRRGQAGLWRGGWTIIPAGR